MISGRDRGGPNLPYRKRAHRFDPVFVGDWYHEFGSGHLPRKVRLTDGIVVRIETVN